MNRREFIPLGATLLIPLTGCMGTSSIAKSFQKNKFTVESYRVSSQGDANAPISFDSRVVDDTITKKSPAKVRFTVKNNTSHDVFLSSSPDPPFGVIYAIPSKYSDSPNSNAAIQASFPLWQKDYNTNSSGVEIKDHGNTMNVESSNIITRMNSGGNISQIFQLKHDMANLSAKEYFIDMSIGYGFNSKQPNKRPKPSQFGARSLDSRVTFEIS